MFVLPKELSVRIIAFAPFNAVLLKNMLHSPKLFEIFASRKQSEFTYLLNAPKEFSCKIVCKN